MPAKILLLLFIASLAGCATVSAPNNADNATSAATQSAAIAQRNAQSAEQKIAAVAAQRAAAERQFCPNWQQALDRARKNAIGCARMPVSAQAVCWQAVSQWANEESQYFNALRPLFSDGAYAAPATHAKRFFDLAKSWAITCQDGTASCTQASGHQKMDHEKNRVNQFCAH